MNIGRVIKSLRKRAGISQSDLADACNLSQTYLSQLEHNKKMPHMNSLQRIAEQLDMPLPVFLFLALDKDDIPEPKRQAFEIILDPLMQAVTSVFLPQRKL